MANTHTLTVKQPWKGLVVAEVYGASAATGAPVLIKRFVCPKGSTTQAFSLPDTVDAGLHWFVELWWGEGESRILLSNTSVPAATKARTICIKSYSGSAAAWVAFVFFLLLLIMLAVLIWTNWPVSTAPAKPTPTAAAGDYAASEVNSVYIFG